MLSFIAIDLKLYKIFKIMRISFMDTLYTLNSVGIQNEISKK